MKPDFYIVICSSIYTSYATEMSFTRLENANAYATSRLLSGGDTVAIRPIIYTEYRPRLAAWLDAQKGK